MRSLKNIFFIFLLGLAGGAFAQLPRLRVSDDKHFLVTADGKPFFWLGDTGWELFHRLDKTDAAMYFKKRSEQGFTVIQAVVLAELNGLHSPNANGDLPLAGDDPAKPNEAYFKYVDTLIDLAAQYHLYIALLPTWGDKVFRNSWGVGPEIFDETNGYAYAKWIGARYKNRTNIIWVIGGDRSPREHSHDVSIWRAMAKGILDGVGDAARPLMTFHPQPDGTSSSSQWFQQDDWLGVNMLQTGHCRDTPVWEMVSDDYHKTPAKPVVNGENIYEEMPVCFNAKELGYGSAYDVRKSAYLSLFAGAAGHVYGAGPVIWFSEKTDNLFAALHTWREALNLNGANEMKYVRALIASRPMLDRVPDQSMIAGEGSGAAERIEATRGTDYAFIYSAYGEKIIVKKNKIAGAKLKASWYDPRTGKTISIGVFDNNGDLGFTPPLPKPSPVPSEKEDWVLILDDAAKNYPMPGTP
ncbi:MAG TPA: glycoside hydrolase family 140 protein [Puia sp.]|nr:glycoside hydrolase family 140 protein [Puia sp.]